MYVAITVDQVLMFHDNIVIPADGGMPGVKNLGHLELVVEKPFQEYFGKELYPGLAFKAAIYFEGIAQAHAFNDGNKRTAVLTCIAFLALNGHPIETTEEELFEIAIAVVTRQMDIHDLTNWIAGRI